ncbi:MAG: hypothetical protein SOZ34_07840 [Clostridia bacterium]|nr:hypothetical protein [Clostridia bacterium]
MLKKLLILALALLMLAGCKKNTENPVPDASSSPQATETAGQDNTENKASDENDDKKSPSPTVSTGPLEAPKVDSAKKDPKRTASIPETPPPDKVVTNTQKTAGSGSRSDEVPDTAVSATSADNAVILAKQYMKAQNIYIPSNVELDREDDDYYYIHAYEVLTVDNKEHTSSVGWFNVNKKTSEVTKGSADIKVGERPQSTNQ